MPGVVARGSERRNATYLAQRVDVQRFEMVTIWLGKSVSRARESAGRTGVRGGQFGAGCCWTSAGLEACLADFVDFDLGAMLSDQTEAQVRW